MKFKNGKSDIFYQGLTVKIDDYFEKNNLSKKGGSKIIIKALLLIGSFLGCYTLLLFNLSSDLMLIFFYGLFGILSVLVFFNFVHDASHKVLFKNKRLNNILRYLGDIVGVNTYIWHIRHDIQHHSFTNVMGGDLIIESIPLIRFTKFQPYKRFHKYQVFYAPILYFLYSIYWIAFLDFKLFSKKEICNLKNIEHSKEEWFKLFFFKFLYFTYVLIIPIYLMPESWKMIILGFFIMHFYAGMLISIVSVLGHHVEGPVYFNASESSIINNSWGEHELETTADFANKSKIIHWVTGGLNTHICHHMFPNICHIHYYNLTPIIRMHCDEFGRNFNEYSLWDSLKSHFQYMKALSKKD